jgi:hypothetical protein
MGTLGAVLRVVWAETVWQVLCSEANRSTGLGGGRSLCANVSRNVFAWQTCGLASLGLLLQEFEFRLEDANVDIPKNWPSRV